MTTATKPGNKTYEILLVEDNPGDVILVSESMKEMKLNVHLNIAQNKQEAMDHLLEDDGTTRQKPDLVILDINLPGENGLDVLDHIKRNQKLKDIPVVVFTTSRSNKDILKTYGLGGTCFMTKPLGFHEYMKSIQAITAGLLK